MADEQDIAAIAGMLSVDQAERIVEAECCIADRHPHCVCGREYDDLIDLGLVHVVDVGGIVRTPMGLAVRSYLLREKEGER